MLPYTWMPCGVTLDRGVPQLVRFSADHFQAMGMEGVAPITDGMLIPWKAESSRGTVWILAHRRPNAFDAIDYRVMDALANFATMAVHHQQQHELIIQQAEAAAAAAMAHTLVHQINNPLQKITNSVYLAATDAPDAQMHVQQATDDLGDLSVVVQQLLVVSKVFKRLQ
jgi:nitrogen-specific signal transduction histidine kinase